jgi:predicted branched-subunit amino acid permease
LHTSDDDQPGGQGTPVAAPASRSSLWPGFWPGFWTACHVPGLVLFATSIGFGALARDGGLDIVQALAVVAAFYAMPAQVVFVDQIARGASLVAGAFLVTLTAVRFMPMTVSIVPWLVGPRTRMWQVFVAVHFMAITTWIEGHRRLPSLAPEQRLAFFVGVGIGILFFNLSGTAIGYYAAAELPSVLSATLLFMTPIYFLLSLIGPAAVRLDYIAVVGGAVFGPIFYLLVPGFDLLLTGLIGGTAAYLIASRSR